MDARITSSDGHDRLTLQYDEGYFRALVWSTGHGRDWRCRVVITQADFQRGADKERWVSALHSFDPATGRAIIKVGEMDRPPHKAGPGGFSRCIYSWREWDLLANSELRVLRACEDPFEEYGAPRKGHKALIKTGDDSVVIDCKVEDWDGCLYNSLGNRRRIELRNLHSSYEEYMKQLAELYHMEFIGESAENRGVFKPRDVNDGRS
jgi:hypothetical protein